MPWNSKIAVYLKSAIVNLECQKKAQIEASRRDSALN
jgi:hypothetical protein